MSEPQGSASDKSDSSNEKGDTRNLIASYTEFMSSFNEKFPNGAIIVWGGVALFLGVAIVDKISTNENSQHIAALYYMSYGAILLLLGKLFMYDILIKILGGMLVLSIIHWVVLLDLHLIYPGRTQLACVVFFWKACDSVAAETARSAPSSVGTSAELDPRIRSQIESAVAAQLDATLQKHNVAKDTEVTPPPLQETKPPTPSQIPPLTTADKAKFKVFLQFAGSYKREEMINFAARLVEAEWRVEGAASGGERTRVAIGYNEVRHPPGGGEAEARALAAFIDGLKITRRPMRAIASGGVDPRTLEIYVSN